MTDKWRRYRDTDLYCTKEGKVHKMINGREVGYKSRQGYILVSMGERKSGIKKRNRIIAECWITYPNPLPDDMIVHHINGIKDDDRVSNLKVVSEEEHQEIHKDRKYCERGVIMDGKVFFKSLKEASDYIGDQGNHIGDCCKGKRKTCRGHTWTYF